MTRLIDAAGAAQVMAKETMAVCPACTANVRGLSPETVQLAATPATWTVWVPGVRLGTLRFPLLPMDRAVPPSTRAVYPSASGDSPVVVAVSRRDPAGATQDTLNVTVAVWPAVIDTNLGLAP